MLLRGHAEALQLSVSADMSLMVSTMGTIQQSACASPPPGAGHRQRPSCSTRKMLLITHQYSMFLTHGKLSNACLTDPQHAQDGTQQKARALLTMLMRHQQSDADGPTMCPSTSVSTSPA